MRGDGAGRADGGSFMRPELSQTDIARLLADPSERVRADVAVKLGGQVEAGTLAGAERLIAADIMRVLVRDAASRVRAALAGAIARAADVPAEVALRIADDVDEIAAPFLARSPVFSDGDLVAVLRAGSDAKAEAIAARPALSSGVSGVIAAEAPRPAVTRLLANETAEIAVSGYAAMIGRWPADGDMAAGIVARPELPAVIAEQVVSLMSEEVRGRLAGDPAVSRQVAERLALEAREQATIGLIETMPEIENMPFFVNQLHVGGRLTGTLIVRAACMGEMRFVEAALARLARISPERAWTLVHDAGRLGLRALFTRAELPQALYLPLRTAVDVVHEMRLESGPEGAANDRARFRRAIIERVLTRCEGALPGADLDFLLYELARAQARLAGGARTTSDAARLAS